VCTAVTASAGCSTSTTEKLHDRVSAPYGTKRSTARSPVAVCRAGSRCCASPRPRARGSEPARRRSPTAPPSKRLSSSGAITWSTARTSTRRWSWRPRSRGPGTERSRCVQCSSSRSEHRTLSPTTRGSRQAASPSAQPPRPRGFPATHCQAAADRRVPAHCEVGQHVLQGPRYRRRAWAAPRSRPGVRAASTASTRAATSALAGPPNGGRAVVASMSVGLAWLPVLATPKTGLKVRPAKSRPS
jgi:hypothetical protein